MCGYICVAGILGNPIGYEGVANMSEADGLQSAGVYSINGTSSSNPLTNDGMLLMYVGYYSVQIFNSKDNAGMYVRIKHGSQWSTWSKLTTSAV